jgi:CRP-like cAMP-binding protein
MNPEHTLAEVAFFKRISDADRRALVPHLAFRTLKRREAAWPRGYQPEEFSFLVSGRLKLVKTNEQGRETIVDLVQPGTLLCPKAACSRMTYCCQAIALEDNTQIVDIPRDELYRSMQASPQLVEALVYESACRNAGLCQRVEELASGQVERRIATLLLRLAEEVGQRRGEMTIGIPVVLSRQDLADMTGTTVETAIRVMSRLGRDKIVQTERRGFVVLKPERLKDISRGIAG